MPRETAKRTAEPAALRGEIEFEPGDFHGVSESMARDPDANARRLETRRKLLTLGKGAVKEAAGLADGGVELECRSSLHHPHAFNGMCVRRLWSYLVRPKKAKRALKSILGSDLAKDLDAAYRNAHLCLALEAEALEASLRIHSDAWYDGQNLKNKVEREGLAGWLAELNRLEGFQLRMDDWKGEWRCGELTADRLEEFLSYYVPGEHRLSVERRWPVPPALREAACGPEAPREMVREVLRLVPLYRYAVWSEENMYLFSS